MNIFVMSRRKAEKASAFLEIPTLIISIRDYNDKEKPTFANNKNIVDILFLNFDDCEKRDSEIYPLWHPITIEDGKRIADVIRNPSKSFEQILVHCEAGISRSAGVAAAIGKFLNNDDMFIFGNGKFCPNATCYRTVLNELMEVDESEVREKFAYNTFVWQEEIKKN